MGYEKGEMNAVKFEFPNASTNGCFFIYHNVKCVTFKKLNSKKNIGRIQILHYTYECYLFWCIYLPTNKVVDAFEKL